MSEAAGAPRGARPAAASVSRLVGAAGPGPGRAVRRLEVSALACTASVAVTLATGIPLVRIVVREADGHAPAAGGVAGSAHDAGWALLPFDAGRVDPRPAGIGLEGGRLVVVVPASVDAERFEGALHRALDRLRISVDGAGLVLRRPGGWTLPIPADRRTRGEGAPDLAARPLFAIDPTTRLKTVARGILEARDAALRSTKGERP